MRSRAFSIAVGWLAAAAACSSAPPSKTSASLALSPTAADVLTCGTATLSATAGGSAAKDVMWSLSPSVGALMPASDGVTYAAPKQQPAAATVTVTATSGAASAAATLTVATAFPAEAPLTGSTAQNLGAFQHALAARGNRVYALAASPAGATQTVSVARSDDGGATWMAPTVAVKSTSVGSNTDAVACAAIAIDAGSPDVVYVYGEIADATVEGQAAAPQNDGDSSFLGVSSDGGATWTQYFLSGVQGSCGDVQSPSPNTVVWELPKYDFGTSADVIVLADGNRGAGFASGSVVTGLGWVANGYTHALDNLDGHHGLAVASNGHGQPGLFSDGNGRVCFLFQGSNNNGGFGIYAMCSTDGAKSFSAPVAVEFDASGSTSTFAAPAMAFAADGTMSVLYGDAMVPHLARSSDGGKTFSTPAMIPQYTIAGQSTPLGTVEIAAAYDGAGVLWIAYDTYDGVGRDRVAVDKSCDGGQSWSGALVVNGAEGSITGMRLPSLAVTGAAALRLALVPDQTAPVALFGLAP